jgi:uncharacterized membrane protein
MRTYIFTNRERRIIQAFLNGEKVDSMDMARIRYMVRTFKTLASDVQLYLTFRKAISAASA